MQTPVTGPLVDFLVSSRWEDVPKDVRHAAKRSILNFFGTALGGSQDSAVKGVLRCWIASRVHAAPRVIGHATKLDMLGAAFVNAASGNVFDFDDTHHRPSFIRPPRWRPRCLRSPKAAP